MRSSLVGTLTETEDAGDLEVAIANAATKSKEKVAQTLADQLKELLGLKD